MRFRIKNKIVQTNDIGRGEKQIEVLERLCKPEALESSVSRDLGISLNHSYLHVILLWQLRQCLGNIQNCRMRA